MTTWQPSSTRPLSTSNVVLGVAIGLAILCAAAALVTVLERHLHEPELGSAVARLDEARAELRASAEELRAATTALHAATRAPTTINIMDLPPPAHAPALPPPPAPGESASCPASDRCIVSRAALERLIADPAALAAQARIMPSVRDGVTRGFKLYGVRPGSLPRQLGLKNGDLLRAVNGLSLAGVDQAMAAYARLRRTDAITLELERAGQRLLHHISIE